MSHSLTLQSSAGSSITWLGLDRTEGQFVLASSQDGSIQCFNVLVCISLDL
jgi:hypothetical protein